VPFNEALPSSSDLPQQVSSNSDMLENHAARRGPAADHLRPFCHSLSADVPGSDFDATAAGQQQRIQKAVLGSSQAVGDVASIQRIEPLEDAPSCVDGRSCDSASFLIIWDEAGEEVIRDLDWSRFWMKLRVGSGEAENDVFAEFQANTKDVLKRAL
ncbi:Tricalbin-2, partial [Tilletia horrida]